MEPNHNNSSRDTYLDAPVDLSNVIVFHSFFATDGRCFSGGERGDGGGGGRGGSVAGQTVALRVTWCIEGYPVLSDAWFHSLFVCLRCRGRQQLLDEVAHVGIPDGAP